MKILFYLFGISIGMMLFPALTFGQVLIAFSNGDWANQQRSDGGTFTYLTCNRSSNNNFLQVSVNGSLVPLYTPTEIPSGWSVSGENQNNAPIITFGSVTCNLSNAQPGRLVIPYSIPGGQSGSVTLYFVNPTAPTLILTSAPALGANQTGTFTASVNPPSYNTATWVGTGGLNVQPNGDLQSVVSTGQAGGMLTFYIDDVYNCGYSTSISQVVGPPFINYTTVNGVNGSTADISSTVTLAIETGGTANQANWLVTYGSASISPFGTSCYAYSSNFAQITATPVNSNGAGPPATFYILRRGYSGYRVAYPNPTKDKLTIEFEYPELARQLLKRAVLINEKNTLVKQFDLDGDRAKNYFLQTNSIIFDVKDLPKGTYYLHIQIGDNAFSDRVIVE